MPKAIEPFEVRRNDGSIMKHLLFLALMTKSLLAQEPGRILNIIYTKHFFRAVTIFPLVSQLCHENDLAKLVMFLAGFRLGGAAIFPTIKNKRIHKLAVPVGLIWWNEMKRHPLNQYAGRVIDRQRTDRGWALEDLADAAGLSKSYFCELERGLHSPSLEVQLRLEAAFGMGRGCLLRLAECALRRAA
jgi:hypothetical protein